MDKLSICKDFSLSLTNIYYKSTRLGAYSLMKGIRQDTRNHNTRQIKVKEERNLKEICVIKKAAETRNVLLISWIQWIMLLLQLVGPCHQRKFTPNFSSSWCIDVHIQTYAEFLETCFVFTHSYILICNCASVLWGYKFHHLTNYLHLMILPYFHNLWPSSLLSFY